MALIRDYEIPGTGVVVSDAYHVVSNVRIEKRLQDVPAPPDSGRSNGLTSNHQDPSKAVYWKAGYIAEISIVVFKDRAARDAGSKPLGWIGINPTDVEGNNGLIGTKGMDHICRFFVDVDSGVDYTTQAYQHLMTQTEYYKHASQD